MPSEEKLILTYPRGVKYSASYGVLADCDRKVKFPFPINSAIGRLKFRGSSVLSSSESLREHIPRDNFNTSKAKPLQVDILGEFRFCNFQSEYLYRSYALTYDISQFKGGFR